MPNIRHIFLSHFSRFFFFHKSGCICFDAYVIVLLEIYIASLSLSVTNVYIEINKDLFLQYPMRLSLLMRFSIFFLVFCVSVCRMNEHDNEISSMIE